MIPELGQLCLCLALAVALLQALVPLLQRFAGKHSIRPVVKTAATVGFMLTSGAFAALLAAHAASDFSMLNVVLNSHSAMPFLYKITGAWGNHEGSMLLWTEVLSLYSFLIAYAHAKDSQLKSATLSILGAINAGFLTFIILTSNPFLRVWPRAVEGEDLNPLLQDIGLALHPPTLYLGYVGFGVVFAYAVAGLLNNKLDAQWAKAVRPWILLPWSFLTLGIGAGSWWAYRELGWGGWWFWDPVENVSLLPWLSGTALLHATMVLEKRGQLARWVAALSILTFSFSLIGTFIVRSGLITSVHAFASDPMRGIFILGYILLVTGGALFVFGRSELKPSKPVALLSRTGFILIGNLLLVVAAATVLIAILYPAFMELSGQPPISVGPQYFNSTFLPLAAPLLVLAALAPLLSWEKASKKQLLAQVKALAPSLLVAALLCVALADTSIAIAFLGVALGLWLLFGAAHYIRALRKPNVRNLASFLAHSGAAVLVLGITMTGLFRQHYEAPLHAKETLQFGAYTLTLDSAERNSINNYEARRGTFDIAEDGRHIVTLAPELRYYPARGSQTTEAAIHSTPLHDLYLVLGDTDTSDQGIGVRLYVTPGQQFVWLGFLLAGLGGFAALLSSVRSTR